MRSRSFRLSVCGMADHCDFDFVELSADGSPAAGRPLSRFVLLERCVAARRWSTLVCFFVGELLVSWCCCSVAAIASPMCEQGRRRSHVAPQDRRSGGAPHRPLSLRGAFGRFVYPEGAITVAYEPRLADTESAASQWKAELAAAQRRNAEASRVAQKWKLEHQKASLQRAQHEIKVAATLAAAAAATALSAVAQMELALDVAEAAVAAAKRKAEHAAAEERKRREAAEAARLKAVVDPGFQRRPSKRRRVGSEPEPLRRRGGLALWRSLTGSWS